MGLPVDINELLEKFDGPTVESLVLMGSYARGDAGEFSDVDLVRFLAGTEAEGLQAQGSYLERGSLIVVGDVSPEQAEAIFTAPEKITECLAGLLSGRALVDRCGYFRALQDRARSFRWTPELTVRRVRKAAEEMVGWIEEVHKGLQGLLEGHVGRLLNARFGLSWGMSGVVRLLKGICVSGDNAQYDETAAAMGRASPWTRLREQSYAVGPGAVPPGLMRQVEAGLELYTVTAALFDGEQDTPRRELALIRETSQRIEKELSLSGRDSQSRFSEATRVD